MPRTLRYERRVESWEQKLGEDAHLFDRPEDTMHGRPKATQLRLDEAEEPESTAQ